MYRYLLEDLISWKNKKNRKPLILKGARQVGKTWLLKRFGEIEYKQIAYINFENNQRMKNLFDDDFEIERIIKGLEIESEINIEPENTLIIFDEIQETPKALTSLKYFYEKAPEYNIVAAGSLLGVAVHSSFSYPVGKVDTLDLFPMNFSEFLLALGYEKLLKLIKSEDFSLIKDFKDKFIRLLKEYYFVGGMPEAVKSFRDNQNFNEVRELQKNLLSSYQQDFSKHVPVKDVPRIRMLWESIPAQLARENKKFIYGHIKNGARAKEFELAMQWLLDCGLIHNVHRISKPHLPLKSYKENSAFKTYLLDVGLLCAMVDLGEKTILEGNRIFTEFKGGLTEQYVLQELKTKKNIPVFYWSSKKGQSEVDFLIQKKDKIIPIEVKAAENLQSKSLKVFNDKFKPEICVRTSMSDYREEDWMINIPLYCIQLI